MSVWGYIWRNVRHRALLSVLTVMAVTITVAIFSLLLMSKQSIEHGAQKGYGPFELVIGAEGSETQLVLNTFYRMGAPLGNIPYELLQQVKGSEHVDQAFGITTGDQYRGYPIVGLEAAYFGSRYENRVLENGRLYQETGEVTVGFTAAQQLGLKVGDQFTGAHGTVAGFDDAGHTAEDEHKAEEGHVAGEEHVQNGHAEESHEVEQQNAGHQDTHHSFTYTVVGILPKLNNSDDRAIFTTMDYAWAVHDSIASEREVTMIIVKPSTLLGLQMLKQQMDAYAGVQAAYSSKAIADVLNMVDSGSQLMMIMMGICTVLAATALILSLVASIQERKRDVGLMRLVGKSSRYILIVTIGEGVLLTIIGALLGVIAGHIAGAIISKQLFVFVGIQLQPWSFAEYELLMILGALILGSLASLGPAIKVYRTDPITLFRQ